MSEGDIGPIPYTVDGREVLTEAEVREYLTAGGYADEADGLIAAAIHFGNWHYTKDRHRCIHHVYTTFPEGTWTAADTTAGEERIKEIGRRRRGQRGVRYMGEQP
jgi:hypothetical protein